MLKNAVFGDDTPCNLLGKQTVCRITQCHIPEKRSQFAVVRTPTSHTIKMELKRLSYHISVTHTGAAPKLKTTDNIVDFWTHTPMGN